VQVGSQKEICDEYKKGQEEKEKCPIQHEWRNQPEVCAVHVTIP
jgi:hypothetical protein